MSAEPGHGPGPAETGHGRGRRCAVVGSPISHSLSPVLHRAAYAELGLDWRYDAYEVREGDLSAFVGSLSPPWRGLSLTMPLKSAVVALCTSVSSIGRLLSSVNTLLVEPDGNRTGHNTDVPGAVAALREAGVDRVDSALVVGSGATAASALAAVVELGATDVTVLARDLAKAARLIGIGESLGARVTTRPLEATAALTEFDVLVSTVPAAAQPSHAGALARLAPVVFDVTYDRTRTALLEAAEAAGATLVPGFALLLHQAARQVELMTGCARAPVAAMRTAGLAALSSR